MWGVFYAYSMVQIKTAEKSNICELVTEVTITFSYQFNNLRIKMCKVHNYVCEQIWKIFIEIYKKKLLLTNNIQRALHLKWNGRITQWQVRYYKLFLFLRLAI